MVDNDFENRKQLIQLLNEVKKYVLDFIFDKSNLVMCDLTKLIDFRISIGTNTFKIYIDYDTYIKLKIKHVENCTTVKEILEFLRKNYDYKFYKECNLQPGEKYVNT